LDLFIPYEYGYEFKVIITNKTLRPKRVAAYHEGRGSQEGIFGELKSHCHQDYIPVRTLHGKPTTGDKGNPYRDILRESRAALWPSRPRNLGPASEDGGSREMSA